MESRCEELVDEVLNNVNTVQYLWRAVNDLRDSPLMRESVKCVQNDAVAAGYMWRSVGALRKGDISLSVRKHQTSQDVERSLRHELVHAFDDARGVVDPNDCLHVACSEVRAARLSGDCFFANGSRNLDMFSGGAQCVKQRAIVAVENVSLCRDFGPRSVEMAFKRCYKDYEPFASPVYYMGSFTKE